KTPSWYDRIAAAAPAMNNPLLRPAPVAAAEQAAGETSVALPAIIPAGKRKVRDTPQQQRGIWLHALLQHLAPSSPALSRFPLQLAGAPKAGNPLSAKADAELTQGLGERDVDRRVELQQRLSIPSGEMEALWQQARSLLADASLQHFFDPQHYLGANNEMPYVNARGEIGRIDRVVEVGDEVWVLDYKLSESGDPSPYRAQLAEYRTAMQSVYAGKKVRCALLFAGGELSEL
ncbi:MAG: PD-(D/E)XK nuclease family protein, partial [Gallionella sp.]